MADQIDPYHVLQVVPTAHQDVVQAAYRTLARLYHPDTNHGDDATRRMVELNRAWRLIGTPAKRAAYDATAPLFGLHDAEPVATTPGTPQRPETTVRNEAPSSTAGAPSAGPEKAHGAPRDSYAGATREAGTHHAPRHDGRAPHDAPPPADRTNPSFEGEYVPSPPGNPFGAVVDFGRYQGWSLGEISRVDRNYLLWLRRTTIGRRYHAEIGDILDGAAPVGATRSPYAATQHAGRRRGWLGRRR